MEAASSDSGDPLLRGDVSVLADMRAILALAAGLLMLTKEEVIDLITGWHFCTDAEFSCSGKESRELGRQLAEVVEWIEAHAK